MSSQLELKIRSTVAQLSNAQAWFVAKRWQQLDGEYRANYLRILSVVSFYLVHVVNYSQLLGLMGLSTPVDRAFHISVTVVALVWLLASLSVDIALRQHYFPAAMPFLTTGLDLAFVTVLLCLGSGQQSPLVLGYPVILVFAAMRFDLVLLRWAVGGAVLAYLYIMAVGRWPDLIGGRSIGIVPRYAQLMTLLSIAITGIALGQLLRRFRLMAEYYASRCTGDAQDAR